MDVTPIEKPVRHRNARHLARLRSLRCCVPGCTGQPVIAHHLTHVQPKARGLKAGDQWAVNLCEPVHHSAQSSRGVHHVGRESEWWARHGIDPIRLAVRLWADSMDIQGKQNV